MFLVSFGSANAQRNKKLKLSVQMIKSLLPAEENNTIFVMSCYGPYSLHVERSSLATH